MSKRRKDAILVFTDGACSGNPGPAGIGVVLVCGEHRKEIAEYIAEATSNIAELTAVVRALSAIHDRTRHVILHSDSEYTIGTLTRDWKIRANKPLIQQARALAATFSHLRFEWVPGHAPASQKTSDATSLRDLRSVLGGRRRYAMQYLAYDRTRPSNSERLCRGRRARSTRRGAHDLRGTNLRGRAATKDLVR